MNNRDLYVAYADFQAGFLYINSTNNDSIHEDVAKAIAGAEIELIKGDEVYRILHRVN